MPPHRERKPSNHHNDAISEKIDTNLAKQAQECRGIASKRSLDAPSHYRARVFKIAGGDTLHQRRSVILREGAAGHGVEESDKWSGSVQLPQRLIRAGTLPGLRRPKAGIPTGKSSPGCPSFFYFELGKLLKIVSSEKGLRCYHLMQPSGAKPRVLAAPSFILDRPRREEVVAHGASYRARQALHGVSRLGSGDSDARAHSTEQVPP